MKRVSLSLIYAAAALSLAAPSIGAPKPKQPFTLTLAAPRQPLKAGAPLLLGVTVTNTSGRSLHIPVSQGSADVGKIYEVHARDERERPAPPRVRPPPPNGVPRVVFGSVHGQPLGPGESLTDQVNVTYLYDLSQPGRYKIWVAEPFYRGPHLPNGLVRSNTITVTVVK